LRFFLACALRLPFCSPSPAAATCATAAATTVLACATVRTGLSFGLPFPLLPCGAALRLARSRRLGFAHGALFRAQALLARSEPQRQVLHVVGRKGLEYFLDHFSRLLFALRFHIEVGNDGEIQRSGRRVRTRLSTGIVLVIEDPRMAQGFEQCRRGVVRLFLRRAMSGKNSSSMKVRHKR
jgi:hypothetical protein